MLCLRIFLILLFVFFQFPSGAQEDINKVKVAFLYKFTNYMTVPTKSGPFVICVLDSSEMFTSMNTTLEGKKIFDRSLQIISMKDSSSLNGCDLVYVGEKSESKVDVRTLQSKKVLLIGETTSGLSKGMMINFVLEDSKVRFEINNTLAQSLDVKINSRLLQLAKKVE